MKLKIHRGANQIGGNIIEIAAGTTKIILDCGRNLPPLDSPKAADPIQIEGLTQGESAYDAVFVTHYHADHCGLIDRVNNDIPIYMSRETKTVLNIISDFINSPLPRTAQILEHGKTVIIDGIKILPFSVKHSAKGAMMFLVESDEKKVLYTGDFNYIDPAYYPMLNNVDILLCEGTNIGAKSGKTEQEVEAEAARIMSQTNGQVFVLCSTTNIDRIIAIEKACRKSGRTMAIDPFMEAITDKIAHMLIHNPVGFVPHYINEKDTPRSYKYLANNFQSFCGAEAISKMTSLTFMVRQTMGEFLKRLDKLSPLAGSTLIYSIWKGYEDTVLTKKFLDTCRSLGMNIEYLHASGHVYREQLEYAIAHLKPAALIPIHTENAGCFREMHDNVVMLEDGHSYDIAR